MAGDAGADSTDEIFASVLCFNMGATGPDGNDSVWCRCRFLGVFCLSSRTQEEISATAAPAMSKVRIGIFLETGEYGDAQSERANPDPHRVTKIKQKKNKKHCLGQDGALMWRIIRLENFVISHHCAV